MMSGQSWMYTESLAKLQPRFCSSRTILYLRYAKMLLAWYDHTDLRNTDIWFDKSSTLGPS